MQTAIRLVSRARTRWLTQLSREERHWWYQRLVILAALLAFTALTGHW